jgi:hypothetical protein
MEIRYFPCIFNRDDEDYRDNPGYAEEYIKFLRENNKSIRIVKIVHSSQYSRAHIYYENLPPSTNPVKESDRFSDMDIADGD